MFASTLVSTSADRRAPVQHTKLFKLGEPFGNEGNLGLGNCDRDVRLVGTENWSPRSSYANEEMTIVVRDGALAEMFRRQFVADFDVLEVLQETVFGSTNDGFDFADHKHNRRIAFQNRGGRFGGDMGNRKRRDDERHDSDIDHAQRLQMERRETRQMIEDGLAEYYSGEFGNYGSRKGRGKRGGASRSRRELPQVVTTSGADHFVEATRTGHVVAVSVKPTAESPREQRKRAMAGVSRSRQHLSTAEIRRRVGLLDS